MSRLAGKVVIVSGAARGMGARHAERLIGEGAQVVIGDVLAEEGRAMAERLGPACRYVDLDVTDPEAWSQAVELAVTTYGGLHGLVNNAGICIFQEIEDYTLEQWDREIAVNLTGTFNGIKASLPALKEGGGGSIVNVSSVGGIQGNAAVPGYTASKFGVRGLTKAVALSLGRWNIRCNSVHPGFVETPMTASVTNPAPRATTRTGTPDDISNIVLYLLSDESEYATGAEFVIDGGTLAGILPKPVAVPSGSV
nr:SDR family oxidoreductase [Salinibacterium sp. ZJ454]